MFYDMYVSLCKEKGISPSKAAEQVGLSRTSVVKWKAGTVPSGTTLNGIAQFFGVSVDYLLGNEQKEKPLVNNDEELTEYLEELKTRPEMKMLFNLAKGATSIRREEGKVLHHYITKYEENGISYAEAWLQINALGKCFCLFKKKIKI